MIRFNSLSGIICLWATLFSLNAQSECWLKNKETGEKFRIFNALLYQNMPDVTDLCIEPINVMYAWEFFPRGHKDKGLQMPKTEHLNNALTKTKKINQVTVIDIEHWPIKNVSEKVQSLSIQNYLDVITKFKEALPEQTVGYYGVIPTVDFSRAKSPRTSLGYKKWKAENDKVLPLAGVVDAIFPSLYTINPNKQSWVDRAKAHIGESYRLAPEKPVYPFIWPDYHDQGGKYPMGSHIPMDYWRLQLTFLKRNADGLVLWGGNKQLFRDDMLWWREIVVFIHTSFEIINVK